MYDRSIGPHQSSQRKAEIGNVHKTYKRDDKLAGYYTEYCRRRFIEKIIVSLIIEFLAITELSTGQLNSRVGSGLHFEFFRYFWLFLGY